MHILAIIFLIIFALIGILAAIFFLMMWINSRDLKKLREDGFYD
jgi:predicted membrane protein